MDINKQKIQNIIFFGSNYAVAQKLNRTANINVIYCEKRHVNNDLYNFAELNDIKIIFAEKLSDIVIAKTENSLGVSYGVGWMFKNRHIECFENGIWNIHTGKLPDNRGRHPISWSFLNNEKSFCISIHSINEEIDQGVLLAYGEVPRDIQDTQIEVEKKLNNLLIEKVIDDAFTNYYNDQGVILSKGIYNKSMIGLFPNINPSEYDAKFIFNLFKSQFIYGGITVNNTRYLYCDFYNECFSKIDDNAVVIICKDSKKLVVK